MWWTAITLAAVAAWFEWQYRHDRKAKPSGDVEVSTDQPQEALRPEQPEAVAAVEPPKPIVAVEPPVQPLQAASPSNTPLTAGRNR